MAKLECKTTWEKLLIPSFIFFFQKLYPFNLVNNNFSNLAAAAGGFILCDAEVFKKENLYKKIRSKIIDDCNLAKLIEANLVIIGPEVPLVKGLKNKLNNIGIKAFGPTAEAAMLEGSKTFSRNFCKILFKFL